MDAEIDEKYLTLVLSNPDTRMLFYFIIRYSAAILHYS